MQKQKAKGSWAKVGAMTVLLCVAYGWADGRTLVKRCDPDQYHLGFE